MASRPTSLEEGGSVTPGRSVLDLGHKSLLDGHEGGHRAALCAEHTGDCGGCASSEPRGDVEGAVDNLTQTPWTIRCCGESGVVSSVSAK